MKTILIISLWTWSIIWGCAAQSDSTILTYSEYLENLLIYHPLAKKANLRLAFAQAERLAARGNLDPVFAQIGIKKLRRQIILPPLPRQIEIPYASRSRFCQRL